MAEAALSVSRGLSRGRRSPAAGYCQVNGRQYPGNELLLNMCLGIFYEWLLLPVAIMGIIDKDMHGTEGIDGGCNGRVDFFFFSHRKVWRRRCRLQP